MLISGFQVEHGRHKGTQRIHRPLLADSMYDDDSLPPLRQNFAALFEFVRINRRTLARKPTHRSLA